MHLHRTKLSGVDTSLGYVFNHLGRGDGKLGIIQRKKAGSSGSDLSKIPYCSIPFSPCEERENRVGYRRVPWRASSNVNKHTIPHTLILAKQETKNCPYKFNTCRGFFVFFLRAWWNFFQFLKLTIAGVRIIGNASEKLPLPNPIKRHTLPFYWLARMQCIAAADWQSDKRSLPDTVHTCISGLLCYLKIGRGEKNMTSWPQRSMLKGGKLMTFTKLQAGVVPVSAPPLAHHASDFLPRGWYWYQPTCFWWWEGGNQAGKWNIQATAFRIFLTKKNSLK